MATDARGGRARHVTVAVLALLLFGFPAWCITSMDDVEPGPDRGTHSAAYRTCRDAIRSQLRAPSTAEFPGAAISSARYDLGDTVRVSSHVDAQNTFGAMLRTPWTCVVVYDGADRYRLVGAALRER